jgi:adenosine deaminase
MLLTNFIEAMPKVELHVHIEGAVRPETLLSLAKKNRIELPVASLEKVRQWYQFKDFPHFIQIYLQISECIQTVEDIEFVAHEFLQGQAEQNIRYTEGTWTAFTHYQAKGISFEDQMAALNRARKWANETLGVDMGIVIDISRGATTYEESMLIAAWAVSAINDGVVAFGLGGMEAGYPPELFKDAFAYTCEQGLPSVPHAGETVGAESIRGAIRELHATRIYHGVRAIEDPELMNYLREKQIPLDICPTSNVCLGLVPSLKEHMLPQLLDAGLYITINSDDPPMFNTSLTNEYLAIAEAFNFDRATIEKLVMNGVNASFLPDDKKAIMRAEFLEAFAGL